MRSLRGSRVEPKKRKLAEAKPAGIARTVATIQACRFRALLGLNSALKLLEALLARFGVRLPRVLLHSLGARGLVARLMPSALRLVARGRRLILVSGTNGKTTTTALLAAALGGAVATNPDSRNLFQGLLDALLHSQAPLAVLEVDELWLPEVLRWLEPELLVLLNLLEDGWSRTPSPSYVIERWAKLKLPAATQILAWAEDPALVRLFQNQPVHWIAQQQQQQHDEGPCSQEACPACGGVLRRSSWNWSCRCGLRHPVERLGAEGLWRLSPSGHDLLPPLGQGPPLRLEHGLEGSIHRRNQAFALVAAQLLDQPPGLVQQRLAAITTIPARDASYRLAGREVRLLMAKNPAAWIANLDRIAGDGPVMLVLQQTARTLDLSWLYDIPHGVLSGRQLGVCGAHALDLVVWLTYAGLEVEIAAHPRDLVPRMPPGDLLCVCDLFGADLIASSAD